MCDASGMIQGQVQHKRSPVWNMARDKQAQVINQNLPEDQHIVRHTSEDRMSLRI